MSVWKNKTDKTLKIKTDGPNPKGVKVAEPGKTVTLDDDHDYLIQSQGGGSANWKKITVEGDEPEAKADKASKGDKAK